MIHPFMKHPHHDPCRNVSPIQPTDFSGTTRRLKACLRLALFGWIALMVVGCEGFYGDKPSMKPMTPGGVGAGDSVILAPGDSIKIFFPGASEYTSTQKITADGHISLPYVGEMHVAGKRVGELQSELTKKFESQLQNNEAVVTLEISGASIIVSGGVRSPGKFNLDRPTTLLDAIFLAGGFNEFANRKKVRLIRLAGGDYTTQTYDLGGAFHGKSAAVVYLKGGDLIEIEEKTW
jgi:polysaccharide biosynthesis/export protein